MNIRYRSVWNIITLRYKAEIINCQCVLKGEVEVKSSSVDTIDDHQVTRYN